MTDTTRAQIGDAATRLHPDHSPDALQLMQQALWQTLREHDGAGSDLTLPRASRHGWEQMAEEGVLPIVRGSLDVAHLADVALRTAAAILQQH